MGTNLGRPAALVAAGLLSLLTAYDADLSQLGAWLPHEDLNRCLIIRDRIAATHYLRALADGRSLPNVAAICGTPYSL